MQAVAYFVLKNDLHRTGVKCFAYDEWDVD